MRRLLLWLLVALIPLQGAAAGVAMALGPMHTHVHAAVETTTLVDFRREPAVERRLERHVATAFGHFHASDAPLRHYHPRSDATVVLEDGGGLATSDSGLTSTDASLLLFATMLPHVPQCVPAATSSLRASVDGWPSLTHDPQPLERPPRLG